MIPSHLTSSELLVLEPLNSLLFSRPTDLPRFEFSPSNPTFSPLLVQSQTNDLEHKYVFESIEFRDERELKRVEKEVNGLMRGGPTEEETKERKMMTISKGCLDKVRRVRRKIVNERGRSDAIQLKEDLSEKSFIFPPRLLPSKYWSRRFNRAIEPKPFSHHTTIETISFPLLDNVDRGKMEEMDKVDEEYLSKRCSVDEILDLKLKLTREQVDMVRKVRGDLTKKRGDMSLRGALSLEDHEQVRMESGLIAQESFVVDLPRLKQFRPSSSTAAALWYTPPSSSSNILNQIVKDEVQVTSGNVEKHFSDFIDSKPTIGPDLRSPRETTLSSSLVDEVGTDTISRGDSSHSSRLDRFRLEPIDVKLSTLPHLPPDDRSQLIFLPFLPTTESTSPINFDSSYDDSLTTIFSKSREYDLLQFFERTETKEEIEIDAKLRREARKLRSDLTVADGGDAGDGRSRLEGDLVNELYDDEVRGLTGGENIKIELSSRTQEERKRSEDMSGGTSQGRQSSLQEKADHGLNEREETERPEKSVIAKPFQEEVGDEERSIPPKEGDPTFRNQPRAATTATSKMSCTGSTSVATALERFLATRGLRSTLIDQAPRPSPSSSSLKKATPKLSRIAPVRSRPESLPFKTPAFLNSVSSPTTTSFDAPLRVVIFDSLLQRRSLYSALETVGFQLVHRPSRFLSLLPSRTTRQDPDLILSASTCVLYIKLVSLIGNAVRKDGVTDSTSTKTPSKPEAVFTTIERFASRYDRVLIVFEEQQSLNGSSVKAYSYTPPVLEGLRQLKDAIENKLHLSNSKETDPSPIETSCRIDVVFSENVERSAQLTKLFADFVHREEEQATYDWSSREWLTNDPHPDESTMLMFSSEFNEMITSNLLNRFELSEFATLSREEQRVALGGLCSDQRIERILDSLPNNNNRSTISLPPPLPLFLSPSVSPSSTDTHLQNLDCSNPPRYPLTLSDITLLQGDDTSISLEGEGLKVDDEEEEELSFSEVFNFEYYDAQ